MRTTLTLDKLNQLADELEAEALREIPAPEPSVILPDVSVLVHAHNSDG